MPGRQYGPNLRALACYGKRACSTSWTVLAMNDDSLVCNGDTRLYVIGDIHGRSDLLDRMVEEIDRDFKTCRGRSGLTVTLGDYVDRGPDSRGVIDRLAR